MKLLAPRETSAAYLALTVMLSWLVPTFPQTEKRILSTLTTLLRYNREWLGASGSDIVRRIENTTYKAEPFLQTFSQAIGSSDHRYRMDLSLSSFSKVEYFHLYTIIVRPLFQHLDFQQEAGKLRSEAKEKARRLGQNESS
jgi:hypothetical protein